MSSQKNKIRSNRHPTLRALLALVGIAGLIGATAPAQASVVAERQALEKRVLEVRAAIHDAAEADSQAPPDGPVAQWYNWRNWGNWNNWPNWGNWGNWFNR